MLDFPMALICVIPFWVYDVPVLMLAQELLAGLDCSLGCCNLSAHLV